MVIRMGSELSLREIIEDSYERPDFSFLDGWNSEGSFFPRLNGAPVPSDEPKGERRERLEAAIEAVNELLPLIREIEPELRQRGGFSDSISVFQRDGEVSVVAIPVTTETRRSLSGFLLSRELLAKTGSRKFFDELRDLPVLAEGARSLLSRRWWQRRRADHELNLRRAAQLILAAETSGPGRLSTIVELLGRRIALASGAEIPSVDDWRQALLRLEALNDLPASSVVSTIEISEIGELKATLEAIARGFARLDGRRSILEKALEELRAEKIRVHGENYSLDDFARRLKGRGFPRKILEDLVLEERENLGSTEDRSASIGDVLQLARDRPYRFQNNTLSSALKLIEEYFEDQKNLLSYPKLTDSGPAFERFLVAAHELYLEQQRPYPVRSQFEVLHELLRASPVELHLIGRNSEAIRKLIGSANVYSDSDRRTRLSAEPEISTAVAARDFFSTNPANFQAVLSNLGFNALSLEQISGFLAPELTKKLKDIDLDLAGMKSQLRSYQTFGVQYALFQERVILGDEMGLGKTVVAVALAKHLANEGAKRFLVTLPLAVLENWRREVLKHTDFAPRVLYGETLEEDLDLWLSEGGIALATFESIQKVNGMAGVEALDAIDLAVVDEAHLIKNPRTKRSRAVLPWVRGARRALLMTGTPLENDLDEFITLISYVQPNLEIPEDRLAHGKFRRAIAPVYLRRNQVDVLQELPESREENDFVELSAADAEYYRRALKNRDWHLMRRAKVLAGEKSATVKLIQNIVDGSVENGQKVLIFSYYLESLDVLHRCLPQAQPYQIINGSLSSKERQDEVDKFTTAQDPGVLLLQPTAGGMGLNIQAASVVIIVEPQDKPSREDQMIGRAVRMGQTKSVRVIRMLAKNTMDERWAELRDEKRKIFEATAGISDAAALDSAMESAARSEELMDKERKAWGL